MNEALSKELLARAVGEYVESHLDAIVQAFYDAGLSTSRHWEWE